MKQLIVNHEKLQTRVALVEDGRLEEYYIERATEPRIVGSIYKGRIRNLEPSLQAAFVDIGLEKNAFLHYWDMIPASIDRLEDDDDEDDESNSNYAVNADDKDDDDDDSDDDSDDDESSADGDSRSGSRRRRSRRRGGRGRNRRSRNRSGNDDGSDDSDDSDDDSDDDDGQATANGDDSDDEDGDDGEGGGQRRGRRRRSRSRSRRGGRSNTDSGDSESDDGEGSSEGDTQQQATADAGDDAPKAEAPTAEADSSPQAPTEAPVAEAPAETPKADETPDAPQADDDTPPAADATDGNEPPRDSGPPPKREVKAMKAETPPPPPPEPEPEKDEAPTVARQSLSLTQKLKMLFSGSRDLFQGEKPAASVAEPEAVAPGTEAAEAASASSEAPAPKRRDSKSDRADDASGKARQDDDDDSDDDEDDDDEDGEVRSGGRSRRRRRRRSRGKGGDDSGGGNDSGSSKKSGSKSRSGGGGGGRRRRQARSVNLDDIPKQFTVNSEVVVQVTKGMIGEKGPRVTTNLSIPGRYTVLLPNSDHRGVSRRIEDRKERNRLREVVRSIDLPKNMGLICRTAGIGLTDEAIRLDVELLMEKWNEAERLTQTRRAPVCTYGEPNLLERTIRDFLSEGIDEIVIDTKEAHETAMGYINRLPKENRPRIKYYDHPTPIFVRYRLRDQIDHIFRRKVTLPSGAELCIDETEALIAIDINSGRSRGGKDHPETILNTNLEAAEEVARQLRLRNIGGLVVVDFIDMRSRRDQLQVYRRMKDSLTRDRAKTKILPLSKLGLMEMTRQREHESLQDTIFETCSYCHGRGIVKSATTISVEIQRRLQEILRRNRGKAPIRVVVHPRVLDRLKTSDANILRSMEREYGGDLSFRSDPNIHQESFHLIDTSTGKEI